MKRARGDFNHTARYQSTHPHETNIIEHAEAAEVSEYKYKPREDKGTHTVIVL